MCSARIYFSCRNLDSPCLATHIKVHFIVANLNSASDHDCELYSASAYLKILDSTSLYLNALDQDQKHEELEGMDLKDSFLSYPTRKLPPTWRFLIIPEGSFCFKCLYHWLQIHRIKQISKVYSY